MTERLALTAAAAMAVLAVPALAAADRARPWEDPAARDFDREEEERSEFWERAIRPRHDEYDELVAGAQRRLGQQRDADGRAAAEAMLLRAVALEPDSPQAYWFLGALYAESARWEECASARQKIFDLDPDYRPEPRMGSPWALDLGLGECLGLAGHYERAIEHYQRILTTRQATGAFPVHWHLGEALMALGRLGEAIDALKTAAKLVGDREPLVHYALAVAYDRDEQLALSRDHMAIALARDPQLQNLLRDNLTFTPPADRWYYRGLAEAGRPVSRPEWALFCFRRFLAEDGDGPWARRARHHMDSLTSGSDRLVAERIEREGVAGIDLKKAAAVIASVDPSLQRCVAPVPNLLLRVRITSMVGQRGRSPAAGTTPAGVRTIAESSFDTPAEAMYHAFCVRAKRARTSSVTVASEAAAVKSCVRLE